MLTRVTALSALVLPLLIVSVSADAQTQSKRVASSQTTNAAIEARQNCFREAQARVPMDGNNLTGTQSERTAIYKSCAIKAGVRP